MTDETWAWKDVWDEYVSVLVCGSADVRMAVADLRVATSDAWLELGRLLDAYERQIQPDAQTVSADGAKRVRGNAEQARDRAAVELGSPLKFDHALPRGWLPHGDKIGNAIAGKPSPQSLGGKARAEKLSPDRRAAIARSGAAARWGGIGQEG